MTEYIYGIIAGITLFYIYKWINKSKARRYEKDVDLSHFYGEGVDLKRKNYPPLDPKTKQNPALKVKEETKDD